MRDGLGQGVSRGGRIDAGIRNDGDRHERQRLGEPDGALLSVRTPGGARPAQQRGREIVRVALELEPPLQELLGVGRSPERGAGGDEPERDDGRARPEAAVQRDPVREDEPAALDRSEEAEGADAEVIVAARQIVSAQAVHLHPGPLAHLELVPEVERDCRAVEAGADVGGRCRCTDANRSYADAYPLAAAMASGSGST